MKYSSTQERHDTAPQFGPGPHMGLRQNSGRGTEESLAACMEQDEFRTTVTLGLLWLRLIDAGDVHAIAARNRMLAYCTDFTRESVCNAFASTDEADVIRAHTLGRFMIHFRNRPAARILLRRLSSKICL